MLFGGIEIAPSPLQGLALCYLFAWLPQQLSCSRAAGAKVLFGGTPLEGHSIPDCYGAIKPTAVFVPLEEILKDENFDLVTTEVFGPVQVNPARLPSGLIQV